MIKDKIAVRFLGWHFGGSNFSPELPVWKSPGAVRLSRVSIPATWRRQQWELVKYFKDHEEVGPSLALRRLSQFAPGPPLAVFFRQWLCKRRRDFHPNHSLESWALKLNFRQVFYPSANECVCIKRSVNRTTVLSKLALRTRIPYIVSGSR